MHDRLLRRLLIVLLLVTTLALAWNAVGMNTTLAIDSRSPYLLDAIDDQGPTDGRSVATVSRADGTLGLDCQISRGAPQPSCEMHIGFRKGAGGIDLDVYDSVRLWVTASGPEPAPRVRVSLHDLDRAVGVPRIDSFVYEPAAYPGGVDVPLRRFSTSPRWLDNRPASSALALPDFRNVSLIAFATGPDAEPGLHRIRVQRVEFRGKLISAARLRLALVGLWILTVAGYLLVDAVVTHRQLHLSAASQLSLQRLNESFRLETRSLAELARTDPLTGLLNRKGLADELTRLVRLGGDAIFPLTLVFIDIDHFKRVNDTLGHSVGDQVMRGLADLVRSAVQRDDLFARWGGEEFLLVFRNTPGLEGRTIAERLRERIANAHWPHELHLTCSFGVTEWQRGEDLNDGIQRADEAMYRAKHHGRDRVEMELEQQDEALPVI